MNGAGVGGQAERKRLRPLAFLPRCAQKLGRGQAHARTQAAVPWVVGPQQNRCCRLPECPLAGSWGQLELNSLYGTEMQTPSPGHGFFIRQIRLLQEVKAPVFSNPILSLY